MMTKPKTIEELEDELCIHCPLTDGGTASVNTNPMNLCEGRACDEAYSAYLELCEEEEEE